MKIPVSATIRIALVFVSASLVLTSAVVLAGDASTGGFYLSTDAGVNLANNLVGDAFGFADGTVSLNPGVRWDLTAGYAFKLPASLTLAPELEVGYLYNSFDHGSAYGQNVSGGGSLTQVPVLANAVLSYPINSQWSVYGGFGLGIEYFDVSVTSGSILNNMATTEGCFVWQGMVGIKYSFGSSEVGLGYKYLESSPLFFNDRFGNSAIMASYTFHF